MPQGRPRFARRGQHVVAYDPAGSRDYKSWIRTCAYSLQANKFAREIPLKMAISVDIERPKSVKRAYPVTKPDVDNLAKTIMDALEYIVFEADQQIVELSVLKRYAAEHGVTVTITPVKGENNAA